MPNSPFDFRQPAYRPIQLMVNLPDFNKGLANLIRSQAALMRASAPRSGGRGGGGRNGSHEGNPRYGSYVDLPKLDGTGTERVWVEAYGVKAQKEARDNAIKTRQNQILAADTKLQSELAKLPTLSAAGQKESIEKIRKEMMPGLIQKTGMSAEELSKQILTKPEQEAKKRAELVNEGHVLRNLMDGAKMTFNSLAAAAKSIGKTPSEKLAIGRAAEKENAAIRAANPYLDEQARLAAEGKSSFDYTLSNPLTAAASALPGLAPIIAPGIAGAMVGGPVGLAAGILGGAAAAGTMSAGEALERVASDPNLSEADKLRVIDDTQTRMGLTSAAIGAVPIGPFAAARGLANIGKSVAQRAVAQPGYLKGIPQHMADAAVLGGAFQAGSNVAYGAGTGTDVPVTQGLGEAMLAGAALGLPFGAYAARQANRGRPAALRAIENERIAGLPQIAGRPYAVREAERLANLPEITGRTATQRANAETPFPVTYSEDFLTQFRPIEPGAWTDNPFAGELNNYTVLPGDVRTVLKSPDEMRWEFEQAQRSAARERQIYEDRLRAAQDDAIRARGGRPLLDNSPAPLAPPRQQRFTPQAGIDIFTGQPITNVPLAPPVYTPLPNNIIGAGNWTPKPKRTPKRTPKPQPEFDYDNATPQQRLAYDYEQWMAGKNTLENATYAANGLLTDTAIPAAEIPGNAITTALWDRKTQRINWKSIRAKGLMKAVPEHIKKLQAQYRNEDIRAFLEDYYPLAIQGTLFSGNPIQTQKLIREQLEFGGKDIVENYPTRWNLPKKSDAYKLIQKELDEYTKRTAQGGGDQSTSTVGGNGPVGKGELAPADIPANRTRPGTPPTTPEPPANANAEQAPAGNQEIAGGRNVRPAPSDAGKDKKVEATAGTEELAGAGNADREPGTGTTTDASAKSDQSGGGLEPEAGASKGGVGNEAEVSVPIAQNPSMQEAVDASVKARQRKIVDAEQETDIAKAFDENVNTLEKLETITKAEEVEPFVKRLLTEGTAPTSILSAAKTNSEFWKNYSKIVNATIKNHQAEVRKGMTAALQQVRQGLKTLDSKNTPQEFISKFTAKNLEKDPLQGAQDIMEASKKLAGTSADTMELRQQLKAWQEHLTEMGNKVTKDATLKAQEFKPEAATPLVNEEQARTVLDDLSPRLKEFADSLSDQGVPPKVTDTVLRVANTVPEELHKADLEFVRKRMADDPEAVKQLDELLEYVKARDENPATSPMCGK